MTESRFLRELKRRQHEATLNAQRQQRKLQQTAEENDVVEELAFIVHSKLKKNPNFVSSSRRIGSQKYHAPESRDGDESESVAESDFPDCLPIVQQQSFYCKSSSTNFGNDDNNVDDNKEYRDEYDNQSEDGRLEAMLDEALQDNVVPHENGDERSSCSIAYLSSSSLEDEEPYSFDSSFNIDEELRLILSESDVAAPNCYQAHSNATTAPTFYDFSKRQRRANERQQIARKFFRNKTVVPPRSRRGQGRRREDMSETSSSEGLQHNDERYQEEEDQSYYEMDYFPEPSVFEIIPGLGTALDAIVERCSMGPCAKDLASSKLQ